MLDEVPACVLQEVLQALHQVLNMLAPTAGVADLAITMVLLS